MESYDHQNSSTTDVSEQNTNKYVQHISSRLYSHVYDGLKEFIATAQEVYNHMNPTLL